MPTRTRILRTLVAAALGSSMTQATVLASNDPPSRDRASPGDPRVADFMVVDCLLPGQVRRLGTRSTYVSARRAVRTAARDCRIRGGEYVDYDRADLASALDAWLPRAESGDTEAQEIVGEIYERGLGTAPDYAEAVRWYRRAAEGGSIRAQINLGHLFETGRGVAVDPRAAVEWYSRAVGKHAGIALDEDRPAIAPPTSAPTPSIDPAEFERLRVELAQARTASVDAQSLMAEQRKRLLRLERSAAEKLLAGPELTLVEPVLTPTRDIVPIAWSQSAERVLVGRVAAPAGLASITVNDTPVQPNELGVFTTRLTLGAADLPVTLVAVDRQGKRSDLTFVLRPPAPETTPAPARSAPRRGPPAGIDFGRYHALIIGNNDYQSLPDLATPRNDAAELARLLEQRYGFRTTVLLDASRYQILSALNALRETLTTEDNLLIYYAGHGELDEVNQRGHWLPVDAERDSTANWIPSTQITDILNIMKARQVLLIADSCYAGALTRSSIARLGTGMTDAERAHWLRTMATRRSRTVLASGGLAPVMDAGGGKHSVFAKALLEVLQANADLLDGQSLHREVAARVAYAAANLRFDQMPEYAPIRFAGHEAGEFFLLPRS